MAATVGSNAHGLDAELFTRGKAGQTDNVGVSMVQRHAERMKLEKEQNAVQKLSILLPQLGFFTRIMALRETDWDVDKALVLLRAFSAEKEVQLKVLSKVRGARPGGQGVPSLPPTSSNPAPPHPPKPPHPFCSPTPKRSDPRCRSGERSRR